MDRITPIGEKVSAEYGDIRFCLRYAVASDPLFPASKPRLHDHLSYELHLAHRGACVFWLPDGQITLFGGNFLLIPPHKEHYSYIPQDRDFCNSVLTFTVEQIQGEPKLFDTFLRLADTRTITPLAATPPFSAVVQSFCTEPADTVRNRLERKRLTSEIAFHLLDLLGVIRETPDNRPITNDEVQSIARLENLADQMDVSLQEIADALGYSPRQTSRLIRERFGMTLTQLRNHRRLETAKRLLTECPDKSLQEICTDAGFMNSSLFHRIFKKEYGCTPGEYRARHSK